MTELEMLMFFLILPMLGVGMLLTVFRLVRGPHFIDRVVALDLLAMLAIGMIAAYAIANGEAVYLDIAIIVALLAFLASVAFAYYVERRV